MLKKKLAKHLQYALVCEYNELSLDCVSFHMIIKLYYYYSEMQTLWVFTNNILVFMFDTVETD